MIHVQDVAQYFLSLSNPDEGDIISHLKLQKLCYYAQGFHLALFDEPLFADAIEAWEHGPVVKTLWDVYKECGSQPISAPAGLDMSKYDERVRGLLDEVYEVYGQYSAWKLRNMTHEEPPWVEARGGLITDETMKDYFRTLVNSDETQEAN